MVSFLDFSPCELVLLPNVFCFMMTACYECPSFIVICDRLVTKWRSFNCCCSQLLKREISYQRCSSSIPSSASRLTKRSSIRMWTSGSMKPRCTHLHLSNTITLSIRTIIALNSGKVGFALSFNHYRNRIKLTLPHLASPTSLSRSISNPSRKQSSRRTYILLQRCSYLHDVTVNFA